MNTTRPIVYIVVGSIAFVFTGYFVALCALSLLNISPDPKLLEYMKDLGLFAAGAMTTILSQTRNHLTDEEVKDAGLTPKPALGSQENPISVKAKESLPVTETPPTAPAGLKT